MFGGRGVPQAWGGVLHYRLSLGDESSLMNLAPLASGVGPVAVEKRMNRSFYRRDAETVARELLGQRFVRALDGQRLSGLIVEVEAYLGIPDRAAHTYNGRRTARNASMWKDGGHLYVYFTYGMHHCANIVVGAQEQPIAVLLRALEPTEGLDTMRRLRQTRHKGRACPDQELCAGPARLCQAMGIDRSLDGIDLAEGGAVWVEPVPQKDVRAAGEILSGPRIGVGYAGEWALEPLRFYFADNPYVSRR